jgi:cytochrome c553
MKWSKIGLLASVLALSGFAPAAWAAGSAADGELKARGCTGCHGIPGYFNTYPSYRVPKVGGQNIGYIVAALKAYKSGERSHKTMRAQASSLDEQDMLDIAAYFNSFASKR